MSESLPPRPNLDWLKNRAKERLAVLRSADPSARRADALLSLARDYGFHSWRHLKNAVEKVRADPGPGRPETPSDPETEKRVLDDFRRAIATGNAGRLRGLLETEPVARANVNAAIFEFDSRAIIIGRRHREIVDLLLDHGADINLRSGWWAGGFGVLDHTDAETAAYLISRGAVVDVFAAAQLNRLDRVRELLDLEPSLINSKGGDGGRPLHFAGSTEMIDLLLDRGAEIDARDVDHEGTPAQWMVPRPPGVSTDDMLRAQGALANVAHLTARGAAVDVFMAAALDDLARLGRMLDDDPSLVDCQVGAVGIPLCPKAPGGHQYLYTLGRGKTPLEVATAFNATTTIAMLTARSTPRQRLLSACAIADAGAVHSLLSNHPGLAAALSPQDQNRLPTAAWDGRADAVKLMLDIGFDPATAGPDDGGTALHAAAWHGRAAMVRLILDHPAARNRLTKLLAIRDGNFQATPLDWCCHGSTNGRSPTGEYGSVARMLSDAGGTAGHNAADASAEVRAVLENSAGPS